MAEAVVDLLEPIQVEEHHRHHASVPTRPGQRLLEAVHEQRAVGQIGEHIVMRDVLQAFLNGHAFGDITSRGHEVGDVAVCVLEGRDGLFLVVQRAVLAPVDEDLGKHLAGEDALP